MAEADLGRTSDLDGREITGGCVLNGSPKGRCTVRIITNGSRHSRNIFGKEV